MIWDIKSGLKNSLVKNRRFGIVDVKEQDK